MASLNIVSPATGNPLPRRTVLAGATLKVDELSLIDTTADSTVNLPPAGQYDSDSVVVVHDFSGTGAVTHPITINGNGSNIDGAASYELDVTRGVVAFMRDEDLGEWSRVIVPRKVDGAVLDIKKFRDLNGLGASAGISRQIDLPLIAQSANAAWPAGNFTIGMPFVISRDMTLVGVNVWAGGMGATRNLKARLWTAANGVWTGVYAETFNNIAAAGIAELRFATPQALSAADCNRNLNTFFVVSIWDTSGSVQPNCVFQINNGTQWRNAVCAWPSNFRPDVFGMNQCHFLAGDNNPTSSDTLGFPCMIPIFSDDADA